MEPSERKPDKPEEERPIWEPPPPPEEWRFAEYDDQDDEDDSRYAG